MIAVYLALIDSEEEKIRFTRLYNRYLRLMTSVAKRKVPTAQDVEDVLQDTFFYIAKNFDKIGDVDSPQTKQYVCILTEGFAINKYKKETKYIPVETEFDGTDIINETDNFELQDLKAAVDSLSDEYKNLIYLTYNYGYKSDEIAKMFNMSASSVRKKLQFARAEIKEYLKG